MEKKSANLFVWKYDNHLDENFKKLNKCGFGSKRLQTIARSGRKILNFWPGRVMRIFC